MRVQPASRLLHFVLLFALATLPALNNGRWTVTGCAQPGAAAARQQCLPPAGPGFAYPTPIR
jgi:hypothetical protein